MSVTWDATGSMLGGEYLMSAIVYQTSTGINLSTDTVLAFDTNEEVEHSGKRAVEL